MAQAPSTDLFAITGGVFGNSNNTSEATPGTGAPELMVAAGAGDATKVVGNAINRYSYGMPQSALAVVTSFLNLADTETYSLAVEIQESADGSTWDTAEVIQASTVVKTASGAFTDGHVECYPIYLGDRKQYFRINVTPDFSASGTDTGTMQTAVILGGAWKNSALPAPQASDTV
jgi:hypothetical protein